MNLLIIRYSHLCRIVTLGCALFAITDARGAAASPSAASPAATVSISNPPATVSFLPPAIPVTSFDVGMIHVDKYGSGKSAIILIPGMACGPWVWFATITKLVPHSTIYAITLPGFDGRPSSDRKPLFTNFAKDFWMLLSEQNINLPIIIGHSLGGTLAIALAEEHPERLTAIIAVDGLPIFPSLAYATPDQRASMAAQYSSALRSTDSSQKLASEKQYMSTIGTFRPDLIDPTAQLEAKSDLKAEAAWTYEDLTTDLRPNLAKITIPFLELMPYNQADATPPMSYTQEQTLAFYRSLLAGAPKVSVVAIAPSRHFAMLDQPAAFEKEIESFLASINQP